jgi:exonuclease I
MSRLYRNIEGTRIIIKFVDTDTNELLFEVRDRNWMNIGDFFTETYITELMRQKYGDDYEEYYPNITVFVVGNYSVDDME